MSLNYNFRRLQAELDKIQLSRETMYMIDKVVRQRIKKGPFGMENSELVNEQHGKEILQKNGRIQRLVDGMASQSRIHNVDENPENDLSSDSAVRRINSVCARENATIVPSSVKGIHFSDEKRMSQDPHASIQSVRNIPFEKWCKQKEMMQRLKDKLVEDAKLEILEQQKMKSELNETKEIKNWHYFSKFSFPKLCRRMVQRQGQRNAGEEKAEEKTEDAQEDE